MNEDGRVVSPPGVVRGRFRVDREVLSDPPFARLVGALHRGRHGKQPSWGRSLHHARGDTLGCVKERNKKVGVDWTRLEHDDFDRLVEALLYRVHADAEIVWSPEDSGGDGGRDVLVEYDQRTIIYQLKFYKDGLTSKPESRKRQILSSFKTALSHEPDEWVLVFPSKINDAMSRYLTMLPKQSAVKDIPQANNVEISFRDRPKLDELLSRYPDLLNLVEREDDYVMRAAGIYAQERAVLAGGISDLVSRMESLSELTDSLDPHWGVAYFRDRGRTIVSPVAKHSEAAKIAPITQSLTLRFPKSAETLAAQVETVFQYGGKDTLSIPGKFVEKGEYHGPDFFKSNGKIEQLIIMAGEGNPGIIGKPVRLVLLDEAGELLVDDEGTVTYGATGSRGHTLEMSLSGNVSVELQAPLRTDESVSLTVRQASKGASPTQVRDGVAILSAISLASTVEVHLDDLKMHVLGSSHQGADSEYLDRLEGVRLAADDLAVIQQVLKQNFPMPEELGLVERLWIRALRIALEGGVAPAPLKEMKISLLESVELDNFNDDQKHQALWVTEKGATVQLAGRDLRLPALVYCHPEATFTVDAENRTSVVNPVNDEVFVLYAPDLLRDKSGNVTPWRLPQVVEPKAPALRFEQ